jgi:hypothetical protein
LGKRTCRGGGWQHKLEPTAAYRPGVDGKVPGRLLRGTILLWLADTGYLGKVRCGKVTRLLPILLPLPPPSDICHSLGSGGEFLVSHLRGSLVLTWLPFLSTLTFLPFDLSIYCWGRDNDNLLTASC